MTAKSILPAALLLLLVACNNSSDDKKTGDSTTTTVMSNDTMMHHDAVTSTEVPPLPAIPEGAKVFFKNLKNGATVSSPVKIEMGTDIIRVDTAGPVVAGSGHHHLIVDVADSIASGMMVPKDSVHLHFGKGQTQTELTLSPGKHKLSLQFADGLHRSYGSRLSSTITVNVKK